MNFRGEMSGHARDVFHQIGRMLEDGVIDALKNVADVGAALFNHHAVSVIDMAAAVRCGADKISRDLKLTRHGADIVLQVHGQSYPGQAALAIRTSKVDLIMPKPSAIPVC